jgi:hypothetical protein
VWGRVSDPLGNDFGSSKPQLSQYRRLTNPSQHAIKAGFVPGFLGARDACQKGSFGAKHPTRPSSTLLFKAV